MQIAILPIGEKHRAYAKEVFDTLKQVGIRVEVDTSDETLGKKVRNAKMQKVPYVAVIGDKEMAESSVALEKRDGGEKIVVSLGDMLKRLEEEIAGRK